MTWFFDPEGDTLNAVEFDDGQGNITTVATDVSFSGGWEDPAPDAAIDAATAWTSDQAEQGNTQTAVTALADIVAEDWVQGVA